MEEQLVPSPRAAGLKNAGVWKSQEVRNWGKGVRESAILHRLWCSLNAHNTWADAQPEF